MDRKVIKVDVGRMKLKDVSKYIDNTLAKFNYDISENETAIDLRNYSTTAQILIKGKWEFEEKTWMGWESKVFFRLWRFIYRDIQRKSGFETGVDEYDKFVKKWKLKELKGDYVIVQSREKKTYKHTEAFSNQTYKDDSMSVSIPYYKRYNKGYLDIPTSRINIINRFQNLVTEEGVLLDNYLGEQIVDEITMQGLYDILMIYEGVLSKHQFQDRWETLRIINGTGKDPKYFWKSNYGHFRNTLETDETSIHYHRDMVNQHYLITTNIFTDQTVKWSYTREMWERIWDNRYNLHNISEGDDTVREIYKNSIQDRTRNTVFDEFVLRKFYYYPKRGMDAKDILNLSINLEYHNHQNKTITNIGDGGSSGTLYRINEDNSVNTSAYMQMLEAEFERDLVKKNATEIFYSMFEN